MIRWVFPISMVALMLMAEASSVCLAADAACDTWHSRWFSAFERLRASMEAIRHLKEGSLSSRIQEEMSKRGHAGSLARSVQAVLKERSATLDRERAACRNLASEESQAFEQWRRCAARGNPRRGGFQGGNGMDTASNERKRLLGSLQDLLMEEAYAQYKNYRQPAPPAYSGSGQQPWGVGRNMGYSYPGYGGYQ